MDAFVDSLAKYACGLSYASLPPNVVAQAKRLIGDSIAGALGAAGSEPVRIAGAIAAETVAAARGPRATTLVFGHSTAPDMAAFVNGTMIRFLDFNDTYTGQGSVHPSDMLATVLAVAESCGLGGRELILGTVLGYEVLCALADSGLMLHSTGEVLWDQATFGVIGAAAVASRLMRLTEKQTAHAISLAASSHLALCQIRTGEVSHWKACAVANASRNAIFCARLAASGMTGQVETFEGQRVFFKAAGKSAGALIPGGAGHPFRILRARVKPYPAGYFSQSAIEAALQLRQHFSAVSEIEKVRIGTFKYGLQIMGSGASRWLPETRESADHSLPYVVAMALKHGEVTLAQYENQAYKSADVRTFMQRIEVVLEPEAEREWAQFPLNVVHVWLSNGNHFESRVAIHSGHFEKPMRDAEQSSKFESLASRAGLPSGRSRQLLELLLDVQEEKSLQRLFSLASAF